jgi:hypothetical protein
MSFLSNIIAQVEKLIISALENLILKGEQQGGQVSVTDLRDTLNHVQGQVAERKQAAVAHESGESGR